MNKQITLSVITNELGQAVTHKKEFLQQIERIIPWGEWKGIIVPHYYKGERGNKPFDLEAYFAFIHIEYSILAMNDILVLGAFLYS